MVSGAEEHYLGVVASGREDYYTGGGEAPGGLARPRLGVVGLCGRMKGRSPRGAARRVLAQRRPAAHQLAGGGGPGHGIRPHLLGAVGHRRLGGGPGPRPGRGRSAGLSGVPRHHGPTGANGRRRIGAGGLVAAGFRHRTSRAATANPFGGKTNCVACAIAGDARLGGNAASALDVGLQIQSVIETNLGGSFAPVSGEVRSPRSWSKRVLAHVGFSGDPEERARSGMSSTPSTREA
jgi:hypothetical protein